MHKSIKSTSCKTFKRERESYLPVAKSCQVEEPYREEEEAPSREADIDYYYHCCTVLPGEAAAGPTWLFCYYDVVELSGRAVNLSDTTSPESHICHINFLQRFFQQRNSQRTTI